MNEAGALDLLKGARNELRNWATTLPLVYLVVPSRILPTWNPLVRSPLGRLRLVLRLRNGLQIACRANEAAPFLDIFVEHCYEPPSVTWSQVSTIVDVGANVGIASLWFASRAPKARIVSIEPSKTAWSSLSENIRRNGASTRITAVNGAVGDRSGVGQFRDDPSGSVFARLESAGEDSVPITTLAQLLDDYGIEDLDVLKLDCEGAEYDILLSAEPAILRRVQHIVGEYHDVEGRNPKELSDRLSQAGFAVEMTPQKKGVGMLYAERRS